MEKQTEINWRWGFETAKQMGFGFGKYSVKRTMTSSVKHLEKVKLMHWEKLRD